MSDVDAFLDALQHPHVDAVHRLRSVVLQASPLITEGIKWNAPSFRTGDWFATMNIRPSKPIRLVLHTGAKLRSGIPPLAVDDPDAILQWLGPDRAIVEFADVADVETKRAAITAILQQWVPRLPPI